MHERPRCTLKNGAFFFSQTFSGCGQGCWFQRRQQTCVHRMFWAFFSLFDITRSLFVMTLVRTPKLVMSSSTWHSPCQRHCGRSRWWWCPWHTSAFPRRVARMPCGWTLPSTRCAGCSSMRSRVRVLVGKGEGACGSQHEDR